MWREGILSTVTFSSSKGLYLPVRICPCEPGREEREGGHEKELRRVTQEMKGSRTVGRNEILRQANERCHQRQTAWGRHRPRALHLQRLQCPPPLGWDMYLLKCLLIWGWLYCLLPSIFPSIRGFSKAFWSNGTYLLICLCQQPRKTLRGKWNSESHQTPITKLRDRYPVFLCRKRGRFIGKK